MAFWSTGGGKEEEGGIWLQQLATLLPLLELAPIPQSTLSSGKEQEWLTWLVPMFGKKFGQVPYCQKLLMVVGRLCRSPLQTDGLCLGAGLSHAGRTCLESDCLDKWSRKAIEHQPITRKCKSIAYYFLLMKLKMFKCSSWGGHLALLLCVICILLLRMGENKVRRLK